MKSNCYLPSLFTLSQFLLIFYELLVVLSHFHHFITFTPRLKVNKYFIGCNVIDCFIVFIDCARVHRSCVTKLNSQTGTGTSASKLNNHTKDWRLLTWKWCKYKPHTIIKKTHVTFPEIYLSFKEVYSSKMNAFERFKFDNID